VIAQDVELRIPAPTMARLHAMNIATWKKDPFMREAHGEATLNSLEAALHAIASGPDTAAPVRSVMAQVVIERDRT
jgi:hypothetical protein